VLGLITIWATQFLLPPTQFCQGDGGIRDRKRNPADFRQQGLQYQQRFLQGGGHETVGQEENAAGTPAPFKAVLSIGFRQSGHE
jgi:hypothetical protein